MDRKARLIVGGALTVALLGGGAGAALAAGAVDTEAGDEDGAYGVEVSLPCAAGPASAGPAQGRGAGGYRPAGLRTTPSR
jgi:hypothetical protein